ncbi:NUDIX domain-containing protein [Leptolinea tardivitalis]|uniref:NUDIX domain-containing protein n=1 Tax=Leptolinea tardivitalis TaxID=229920 RepID=UPI0007824475|nr:NUDIX domain-containing protein [Leptolinea tardivitalis]GAP20944.1 aDP-ribose pyrophosphatase [Leptolinea tardivitalis]
MPVSDQGVSHDRYKIIPRVLIFLTRGREVLMIKGSPSKRLWANKYNGIGGHIEQGEDVLSAAYRELKEETGIIDVDLEFCALLTIDTGERTGIQLHVFRGKVDEGSEPKLEPCGEGSLEWVHQFDMVSLPLVEDLPVLIPRVLAFKSGEPPFFGLYSYSPDGRLNIRLISNKS